MFAATNEGGEEGKLPMPTARERGLHEWQPR
jgi:hypothetical protein